MAKVSLYSDTCRFCDVELTEENTYPAQVKKGNRVCRDCFAKDNRRDQKKFQQSARDKVLEHYGKFCACCGEDERVFLAIDHINDDGAEHRRIIKQNICPWLVRNGFPKGFQTLCHNCNFAKSHGGCPHQVRQKPTE